jgi:hypothetical protein
MEGMNRMRKQSLLIGAILVLIIAASAVAADVTGKWVAEQQSQQGTRTTTFNFKVEGVTLTGTVSGRMGDTEISEGKVNGDEISFVVVRKMGEMEMKTTYKGKVAGDEITFTIERPAMGGPGGPGGAGAGPGGGPGGGPGMGAPGGGMGGPGMGGPPAPLVAKRAK